MGAKAMQSNAAYGVYPPDVELHQVVQTLNQAGFDKESICMMVSPMHPIAATVRDAGLFNSDDSEAVSEELIGWLSEFGAVVIPTVGFFIRAREFFHAFVVMGDSPALCGRGGPLVGLGFSASDAERLEEQVRAMGALVYVTCAESAKAAWAVELLRRTGARGTVTVEREAALRAATA
jgi:hypothetical protein